MLDFSFCSQSDSNGSVFDSGCYQCEVPNVQDFDICQLDGKIFVDGGEIEGLEGIFVERVVKELEANDAVFENVPCTKKNSKDSPLPGS